MMSVTVDFIMDAIKEKCGTVILFGPLGHIASGLVGLFANILAMIGLALNSIWGTTVGWVSRNILGKQDSRMAEGFVEIHDGEDDEDELPHMICSKCCAKAMIKGGLLDNSIPTNGFLPKDFLPKDIGADGNLFDDYLNGGHAYSEILINVLVAPDAKEVATTEPSVRGPARRSTRPRPSLFRQPVEDEERGRDSTGRLRPSFQQGVEKRRSMFAMEATTLIDEQLSEDS
jgi:hypothetical protein